MYLINSFIVRLIMLDNFKIEKNNYYFSAKNGHPKEP